MNDFEAKAPRALQALLDAITEKKEEIKKLEALLAAGGLNSEEKDQLQRRLWQAKRELRNLESSFKPDSPPSFVVDPHRP